MLNELNWYELNSSSGQWRLLVRIWGSRCLYLLWQTLVDFMNSMLLWLVLQIKFEPSSHSCISGWISLLRLNVFSVFSTLWSILWLWGISKVWLSRCHFTLSFSGKKPLRVQISLTGEAPTSPSQTGCSVIFGGTTRCSEIWNNNFYFYFYTFTSL